MIPQETVQQIIQSADVVDVVGDFVSLKKRGANMIACCPFHNEKTPSFYVSPAKGIYKCFGCGQGGDAVRFIMELEGLSYPEALKWLAKKYGIEIIEKERTDEDLRAENERESLFIVSEFAEKYFHTNLIEDSEGKSIGLSYFKERGYTQATVDKFQLGYALEKWDALTQTALASGYTLPILEKSGLSIVREEKDPIDRFRGRVVFPIHNVAGKAIAFGARILKVDKKAPKYLNSPETDIYHKSHIVYGIYHSKTAIRNTDNCYLVEGYTDVVSLHQAGVENVVASSGTSLTKEQIQLIRRFTTNITVLYDGDAAGINASLRGTDLILEEGMNVRVVIFPDGEDPDSYVKEVGTDAFQAYIDKNQKDFIRFKVELALKDAGDDPVKRAGLITDIVSTIAKIQDSIKRSVFYRETAKLLEIDEEILVNEGTKLFRKEAVQKQKQQDRTNFQNNNTVQGDPTFPKATPTTEVSEKSIYYQEEQLVRDLVCHGHEVLEEDEENGEPYLLADYYLEEIGTSQLSTPVFGKILSIYKEAYLTGTPPLPSLFTSHVDVEVQKFAVNWLSPRYSLSDQWEKFEIFVPTYVEKIDQIAFKNVLRIKKEHYEKQYEALATELGEAEEMADQDIILDQMMKIKKLITKLADLLGSVF